MKALNTRGSQTLIRTLEQESLPYRIQGRWAWKTRNSPWGGPGLCTLIPRTVGEKEGDMCHWSGAVLNSCQAPPWGLTMPSVPENQNLGHNNATFVPSCMVYEAIHKESVIYLSQQQQTDIMFMFSSPSCYTALIQVFIVSQWTITTAP